VLIAYQKLTELTGFETYDTFRRAYKECVSESLANGDNFRQTQWTQSIAVGSKSFIETIKEKLGILAKGRKILENGGEFQLREDMGT
jgi:putative transposase